LTQLVVTNSIPLSAEAARMQQIKVLSVAELLGKAIRSIHEESSVSSLFI
jgi:ribose-phosphate pyrophosphokinase